MKGGLTLGKFLKFCHCSWNTPSYLSRLPRKFWPPGFRISIGWAICRFLWICEKWLSLRSNLGWCMPLLCLSQDWSELIRSVLYRRDCHDWEGLPRQGYALQRKCSLTVDVRKAKRIAVGSGQPQW